MQRNGLDFPMICNNCAIQPGNNGRHQGFGMPSVVQAYLLRTGCQIAGTGDHNKNAGAIALLLFVAEGLFRPVTQRRHLAGDHFVKYFQ